MKKLATIVDYGLGNIVSAQQSFLKVVQDNSLDIDVIISHDPEKIKSSSYIVLPGQGAFQSCMDGLNNIDGMVDVLEQCVLKNKVPFLGICLGAQILVKYLGCKVEKNPKEFSEIGFYKIQPTENGIKMFQSQDVFYQFHTEGFELPSGCELLAKGDIFTNQAFRYKNCYGLQFHPEVNIYLHLKWLFLIKTKKSHFKCK